MIITGQFNNRDNDIVYGLEINGPSDDVQLIYDIKDSSDDVYDDGQYICFGPDPIHIECDYSDTFSHNVCKSATISLVTNFNLKDVVMSSNYRDISVTITATRNNTTYKLFSGYIEPLCFSQGFSHNWETLEITATDDLATSQYIKYPSLQNVLSDGVDSPYNIIDRIANTIGLVIDTQNVTEEVARKLTGTRISNSLWIGESQDDWMTCFDVLEALGKYWGLWFFETGDVLKVYDWHNLSRTAVNVTADDYVDASTALSNADAYTQIKLACNLEDAEPLLEFGEDLQSPYRHYAKYLTELISEGGHSQALLAFTNLVIAGQTEDNSADTKKNPRISYTYDNFCWIKKSNLWDFGQDSYTDLIGETNPDTGQEYTQQEILAWLRDNPGKGAFVSFGRTDKRNVTDDSPINSVSLTDYLVISMMGQDSAVWDETQQKYIINESDRQDALNTQFSTNSPICSFNGQAAQFTPADTNTTNYIVISGKMLLNKLYPLTGETMHCRYKKNGGTEYNEKNGSLFYDSLHDFKTVYNNFAINVFFQQVNPAFLEKTVPNIGSNEYGSYYTHEFYNGPAGQEYSPVRRNSLLDPSNPLYTPVIECLYGDLKQDKLMQTFKYEYSDVNGTGKRVDNTSKIPLLRCQLKIGDKYCVERFDQGTNGWGHFDWMTYEDAPTIDEEKWTYFTIGINPKLDDYIIGKEMDIQNTVWYYNDIEKKGTAIPINYSDNLFGAVEFKIMGPVNTLWESTNKKVEGKLWWRHTVTTNDEYSIMDKLSSIMLSDFKIEIVSDKGHILNNTENNDLVYASDMNNTYVDSHEDDTIIATMLTSEEAAAWNVEVVNSVSHVSNADGSPFLGYPDDDNEGEYIKPEQLYVDSFYKEYSKPRTVIETGLAFDNMEYVNNPMFYKFNYSYLDGEYVPVYYDAGLKYNNINFRMKDMSDNE